MAVGGVTEIHIAGTGVMDRDEAIKLLNGGTEGIAEWNRRRRTGETIPDLARVDVSGPDLRAANLSETNLSEANLAGVNLKKGSIFKARLCRANLSGADLRKCFVSWADLQGADLRNSNLSRAKCFKAKVIADARGWGKSRKVYLEVRNRLIKDLKAEESSGPKPG
jgi:hypothetical protein